MNMTVAFVLALLPIIWLIVALTAFKIPGFKACAIALVIAYTLAVTVWEMPLQDSITAVAEGSALALWPIIIVIIAAIFTYNVCLATGKMDMIKKMLASVTNDKRVLVLIIAWGFGGFMEGMAGFGTAVAIPASMLWGLGFNPVFAAIVCLIANATPTAFGSIGIPTTTLAGITSLDVVGLSTNTVILLAPLIILTPFILVYLTGKAEKGGNINKSAKGNSELGRSKNPFKGIELITLISGLTFLIPEFLVAKFLGAELPVVIGSVCSMLCTAGAAKLFGKKVISPEYCLEEKNENKITGREALIAWSPFILIFFFLLGTSKLIAPLNELLAVVKTSVNIYTGEGAAPYTFSWLTTPGLWIILAALVGGKIQGAGFSEMITVLKKTIIQMFKTVVTIISIMATAKLMGYSGMIASISLMFVTVTGSFYPLFAPLLGSIGTFVTGSGTSSSVLFGGLQAETGAALNLNQVWISASNTAGATTAKMISPQSIAVAVAAVHLQGKESVLLKGTFKYYLLFLGIVGALTYVGAQLLG
ncbi:L-lactate permease [Anaerocolumna sp. MB42-C2]|uniref:L-lactate permease n=1 Tax=Anaerocolumna sp. MB42-C2 TaxID=3070997 RepID=UPI0027E151FF|nr:L-lactate permease [Anaerocolumna sp. MB42-C2]WMJ87206.1 L-lactate permease [Anaerocolumna sp. MB42-C2]